MKQLTKSLLKRDFGIQIELPDDRLCPPVPNRFNYILWIQELLDTTSDDYRDAYDPEREIIGLDIGTGSSCIYPLLGCAQRPKWRFIATDIDDKNIHYARQNILSNNLQSRIRPLHTKDTDPLIPLDKLGIPSISFTLSNPPFYPTPTSLLESASQKSRPPHSACTGSEIEMVTPGGEVSFVSRHIRESLILGKRCQWYTTMLGKLSSVATVVEELKARGIGNWAVKEFVQGQKTRRWGVGWSFEGRRPSEGVCRGVGLGTGAGVEKRLLPPSTERVFLVGRGVEEIGGRLNGVLSNLEGVRWDFRKERSVGVGFSRGNVWSRAARRRMMREGGDGDGGSVDEEDEEGWTFGFKIQLRMNGEGEGTDANVRWLLGMDGVLFESFCGMLKRQIY